MDDGSSIMEMNAISYGLVEAARYWYKNLKNTFKKKEYKTSAKDKCVFIKRTEDKVAFCATRWMIASLLLQMIQNGSRNKPRCYKTLMKRWM